MAAKGLRTLLYAHVQTCRPYTLWYVGLVGMAGAAIASDRHDGWRLMTAWAGPTLGWIGGHYLGDYLDRRLDAISKPHRPIPSGRLRPRSALASGLFCLITAGCFGLLANWQATVLTVGAAAGILAYNGLLKGRGLAGNMIRGALTAAAFLFGATITQEYPPVWLLPFAAVFWLHDAASNLIGALRDVEGDRAGGYQTLPVRHGMRLTVRVAALLYTAALILAAVCWRIFVQHGHGHPALGYPVLVALATGVGLATFASLLRDPERLSPSDSLRAHEVLVIERLVLAGAMLSLGVGIGLTLMMVLPMTAISLLAQTKMRANHEFTDYTADHLPRREVPTSSLSAQSAD